jgi:hypothetical protein
MRAVVFEALYVGNTPRRRKRRITSGEASIKYLIKAVDPWDDRKASGRVPKRVPADHDCCESSDRPLREGKRNQIMALPYQKHNMRH